MRIRLPIHRILGTVVHGDLGPYTMYRAHDGGLVVFLSAPPKTPASPDQVRIRNRYRALGRGWQAMSPADRSPWILAAKRARLRVHGYGLFAWYGMTADEAGLRTILRLANVTIPGYP
jgi:hypothetical protein